MPRRRLIWLLALLPLLFPLGALALATLTATPSNLSFDERCVRTDAHEQEVTVTNAKNPAATNVRVAISPSAMAEVFPLSGKTAVPTLAPDDSFTFDVGFVPQKEGKQFGKAVITYNASEPASSDTPSPSPKARKTTVALEGEGIDRFVDASPKAVDFGRVRVGGKGPDKTVTVYDDGDTPLSITGVFIGGRHAADFSVTPKNAATATDGNPHELTVTFRPRDPGARAAELFIRSNSCEDRLFKVALGGLGIEPEIAAIPDELTFFDTTVGKPRREELTIANQGGLPLRVTRITLSGPDKDSFSIPKIPSLPRTMKPNADFTLRIFFEPQGPGPHEATLEVRSTDPDTRRLKVNIEAMALAPSPSPSPSPSVSVVPSPVEPPRPGFRFSIGEYLPELGIALAVAGFFAMLAVVRRVRGIPE